MDIKTLEAFSLSDAVKFHDELNPKLWRNNELRPDVKKQLLLIAQDFMQELGLDDLKVEDITLSGSNAAYTYTDHSDLDLHILVDFNQLPNNEVYQELFNAKKTLYNDTHDITIYGVPIELYVQDSNQPVVSLGEYSLKNNSWIKIPKKRKADLDQTSSRLKYNKLYDLIQLALKSKNIEKVNELLKTIKRYRQAGLDQGGEFSPENLAFKALRSQGLINKLYALKNKLHSDELTIEDYDPNGPPPGPEFPPTMPAGTVRVDVSDVYDWYKLGQHISNMKGLGKHDFGKGPPSTIMSFGDEDLEHQYIQALQRTGLSTTDIDPAGHKKIKGQKTDPTYNVNESSFNKCFDKACEVYDKALKKNLKPAMYQVADYVGDAENADSKWQKLPKHVWSHYVTVVNDIVLDPTAKQFGDEKPTKYSFDELQNNWKKIFKIKPKEIDEAGYKGNLGISELTRLFIARPELKPKFLEIKQKHGIEKAFMWAAEQLGVKLQPIISKEQGVAEGSENLSYIGNCTDDDVIEHIFGDATNFAQAVEEHGDEFTINDLVVKYDPKTDVHSFYYKKQGVAESASGYIPSKKQANDPRYKTALTVDVKPDTIKKNAKAFGFKVSRAGIPPLLREGQVNPEGAIFLNDKAVVVGQLHGEKLNLSPETQKKVKFIADKYGAWYEGDGKDAPLTKGIIDNYKGSWDDLVGAKPDNYVWVYTLFSNVKSNQRLENLGENPKTTIFQHLLKNADKYSYQNIGVTPEALKQFLIKASEGNINFLKMSQDPATTENLKNFLETGEALMWPSNWEQYPHNAGKIAKAATVDVRDKFLASRQSGVYVVGGGHLTAVQELSGKQAVAEQKLLREDVSNDYLYHGTNAEAAKQILNTGNLTARVDTKQRASQGQTQDPTVSFTRSWDYLMNPVGGGRTFTTSYPVIFVFSRDKIEQKYKTMGTSQSYDWRGLPFVPDEVGTVSGNPQSKAKTQVDLAKKWLDKNKDGRISKDEINAEIKRDPDSDFIKIFRTKVAKRYGSEFEEIVPVKATGVAPDKRLDGATAPIGKLPTKDILVGFWVNPNSDAINDKQLMNDPLRLEIPGFKNTDKDKFYKHTFVRANKQTEPMTTKTYDPVEKQKQSQLGAEKAKQIASRRADAMHAFNPSKEKSVAEQKNANTITAYHGTRRDIDKFKPFSHFGTFRAAYDRLDHTRRGEKNEIDNEKIYQVELDINNPIELDVDIFDNHKLSDYVELLQRKKVLDDNEIESIKSPSDLLKTLLDKGYDGIKYKNRWEHPGSISYVIFKPDQVRVSDIITHNQPNKFNRLLTKN